MLFPIKGNLVTAENRTEWLKNRNEWLGGSETSALFQVNRFESEYSLWVRKSGTEIPGDDPSLHMQRGLRFEIPIIDEVRETFGWQIEPWAQTNCVVDREHRLGCTPDSLLIDEFGRPAVGQIKLSDPFMKSYWQNGVPLEYQIQCQTEMHCTGLHMAYVIVVFGLNGAAEVFPIERHLKFQDELLSRAKYFWECVESGDAPEPDGSDATADALRALYSNDDGTAIDLTDDCDMWAQEYVTCKEQLKELEKRAKELKAKMVAALGSHTYATMGDLAFSYKQQTRLSLEVAKVQELYPDVYKKCLKKNDFRVLRQMKQIPKGVEFASDIDEMIA